MREEISSLTDQELIKLQSEAQEILLARKVERITPMIDGMGDLSDDDIVDVCLALFKVRPQLAGLLKNSSSVKIQGLGSKAITHPLFPDLKWSGRGRPPRWVVDLRPDIYPPTLHGHVGDELLNSVVNIDNIKDL